MIEVKQTARDRISHDTFNVHYHHLVKIIKNIYRLILDLNIYLISVLFVLFLLRALRFVSMTVKRSRAADCRREFERVTIHARV